ncbi:zinc finger protein 480-like [Protopterus annectens]|uniref:zinc finger protein 480-like n=1 Tax=Protopterus annectens TaxID=7888 RepID=UPI001CFB7C61|nr:zinc finger protein 480-like [Protopterus annectens]
MQNLCAANGETGQCCGKHKRSLELFCQEDETFICVLCVPKHSSHTFVFLHEAASVYKDKLETALTSLELKMKELKYLQNEQEKEILDIQEDAFSVERYIKQEFYRLHQFLRDKEQQLIQQLQNEEADILNKILENLECIKHDIIASHMVVPDGTLEQEPMESLTVPGTFEDVVVTFSEEEWKTLKKQDKELYREVMVNNYETMVSVGYSISPMKLLQILKEEEDVPVGGLKGGNTIEQKDNLKGKVRGHSIPPMKLLKILKEEDELPIGDIRGGNTVEQKVNLKGKVQGNGHAERSASCIQQPSVGTSQVIYPAENMTQCAQPIKGYHKLHLSSVPQLHSGCNYSKIYETNTSKKTYKCTECKKYFTRLSNLRHHLAVHTGEKPYKCTECGKGFACLRYLRKHYVIHTGDKPYKCTDCDKRFILRSHLEYHQNCHKGLKPFKCPECNKCFADPRSVQKHYLIHTGEKPYKCTDCDKCFTQKAHLKYHQNSHTGLKPYKCTECSKCFTHQSSVRKHHLIHTGEKPYKCNECSKCFRYLSGLRQHHVFHTGEKQKQPLKQENCSTRKTSVWDNNDPLDPIIVVWYIKYNKTTSLIWLDNPNIGGLDQLYTLFLFVCNVISN